MANERTVLITGATGKQGGATLRALAGKGFKLRAMTRNPGSDAAKAIASATGAELVRGDLNDAASLKQRLKGAWGVFAVQNTWEAGVEVRKSRASASPRSRGRPACSTSSTRQWVGAPQDRHSPFREQGPRGRHHPRTRLSVACDPPPGVLHGEPPVTMVPERRQPVRRDAACAQAADDRGGATSACTERAHSPTPKS